jgi:hypothetical protein
MSLMHFLIARTHDCVKNGFDVPHAHASLILFMLAFKVANTRQATKRVYPTTNLQLKVDFSCESQPASGRS